MTLYRAAPPQPAAALSRDCGKKTGFAVVIGFGSYQAASSRPPRCGGGRWLFEGDFLVRVKKMVVGSVWEKWIQYWVLCVEGSNGACGVKYGPAPADPPRHLRLQGFASPDTLDEARWRRQLRASHHRGPRENGKGGKVNSSIPEDARTNVHRQRATEIAPTRATAFSPPFNAQETSTFPFLFLPGSHLDSRQAARK